MSNEDKPPVSVHDRVAAMEGGPKTPTKVHADLLASELEEIKASEQTSGNAKLGTAYRKRALTVGVEIGRGLFHLGTAIATSNILGGVAAVASTLDKLRHTETEADLINKTRIVSQEHVTKLGQLCDTTFPPESKKAIADIIKANWMKNPKEIKHAQAIVKKLEAGKLTIPEAEKFFAAKPKAFAQLQEAVGDAVQQLPPGKLREMRILTKQISIDAGRSSIFVGAIIESLKASHSIPIIPKRGRPVPHLPKEHKEKGNKGRGP